MLAVGARPGDRARLDRAGCRLLVADAEALPLPDRCVDRVSIAFGLRNCTDKAAVLREARRVLRPGGRFLCLEFSPRAGRGADTVLRRLVVPGAAAARPDGGGDADSYRYLAESIRTFPDQETLAGMMRAAGLGACRGAQSVGRHRGDPLRLAAMMSGKRVLLIVPGGIAAYKALELIRLLRGAGCGVTCVLTDDGAHFVTPLSLQALSETQGLHRPVLADRRERDGAHPAVARGRPGGGRAGDRQHPGEDGGGAGGRSRDRRCCWPPTSRCWSRRR